MSNKMYTNKDLTEYNDRRHKYLVMFNKNMYDKVTLEHNMKLAEINGAFIAQSDTIMYAYFVDFNTGLSYDIMSYLPMLKANLVAGYQKGEQ